MDATIDILSQPVCVDAERSQVSCGCGFAAAVCADKSQTVQAPQLPHTARDTTTHVLLARVTLSV